MYDSYVRQSVMEGANWAMIQKESGLGHRHHERHERAGLRRGECGGELFWEKYVVDCEGDASDPGR